MNKTRSVKILCVISMIMYFIYYNYWSFGNQWHSSEAISIISNFLSPVWFSVPDFWQYFSFFIWILVYFLIFIGLALFRHALLLLVAVGFFINTSSEVVVMTNIDLIVLDIWRLSDGALLYLLYFDPDFKNKEG